MKKQARILLLLLTSVLVAGLALVGCTTEEGPGEEVEPIELSISLWSAPVHHNYTHVWDPWSKELAEKTDGRVTATIYASGALGSAVDQYDVVAAHGADIAGWNPGFTPGRFPLCSVAELPYMNPTQQIGTEIIQRLYDKYPEFQEECDPVLVLMIGTNIPIVPHTVSKPIYTMEDFQGLTIRVNSEEGGNMITALGGTPVFMGMMDLYTALERGTVDGAIYTVEAVQSFGLGPVTNYTVEAPITTVQTCSGINADAFNSLPTDVQELITTGELGMGWLTEHNQEAMALGGEEGYAILRARGDDWEQIFLTPEEEARWIEALTPLRDAWAVARNAEGLPGTDILNDALAYLAELTK